MDLQPLLPVPMLTSYIRIGTSIQGVRYGASSEGYSLLVQARLPLRQLSVLQYQSNKQKPFANNINSKVKYLLNEQTRYHDD
jgi:hypothetical protein